MSFTDTELKYRNDVHYVCKPMTFEEVDDTFGNRRVKVPSKDAENLRVFSAEELQIESPMDWIENPQDDNMFPNIFILKYNQKTYLVNTEGYDYCRYVARCEIC